jgi:hypothetical protein
MRSRTRRLADSFTGDIASFTSSPLYQSFCRAVAADRATLRLLRHRRTGQQPSYLLFGAVHYLLLDGVSHPLRRFYPSLAGAAAAAPEGAGPALIDFCHAYRAELAALIGTRLVQTNVVKRALALRVALAAVGERCREPVHLIEVGSSAGVHLYFDRYRYVLGGRACGPPDAPVTIDTAWHGDGPPPDLGEPPPVASRTGIDLRPVDARDPSERLWLRALVWPEDQHKADLLAAALDVVAAEPPTILAGDAADVCPALGRRLPPGEPRVVFHAATRMHVPPARRAAFDAAIDAVGGGGPLYHAWLEPASAPHHGYPPDGRGQLTLHGPAGGPVPLGRADGHLEWLAPPAPPRP